MASQKEYNPRVRELRTEPSLSPAVSSAQLYSFDEKRPDFVMEDRTAGMQYRQLAKALGQWDPVLAEIGQRTQENKLAEGRTKMMRGEVTGEDGKPLTLETIATWEKGQGFFTGESRHFIQGVKSVLLENAGMAYDSHMQKFATESGLLNIKDPAERARILQEESTRYRQELLERLGPDYKDDFPLIEKFFNNFQTQTQAKLVGHLASQQARIHSAEAQQAFQERIYATLDTVTNSPGYQSAPPAERQQMLARMLGGSRLLFENMGMSGPEVDALLLAETQNYLDSLETGPNDFRADDIIGALGLIPTKTGFLGQTAEVTAKLRQLQDKADAREERASAKEERRLALAEKQENRDVQVGISAFLEGDNSADYNDFMEAHPELAKSRFARDYFHDYQGFISNTQDRAETATSLDLEEELTIGLMRGTHTMDDVLAAEHSLTRKQREGLLKRAEHMITERDQIMKIVGTSQFAAFQKNIVEAQQAPLKSPSATGQVAETLAAGKRSVIAQQMAEAALYREISQLLENGVSYDEIQRRVPDMLNRISAPLMDPANVHLNKRVEEYMKTINVDADNPLMMYDFSMGYQGGKSPSPKVVPQRMAEFARLASQETGVPGAAGLAVMWAESDYFEGAKNPDPKSTAFGPMQLVKGTADWEGVQQADPQQNVLGGFKHLARIAKMHNLDLTNPEDVQRAYLYYHDGPGHKGVHSEAAYAGAARVAEALKYTPQVEAAMARQQAAWEAEKARETAIQQQREDYQKQQVKEETARQVQATDYTYSNALKLQSSDDIYNLFLSLYRDLPSDARASLEDAVGGAQNIDMQALATLLERGAQYAYEQGMLSAKDWKDMLYKDGSLMTYKPVQRGRTVERDTSWERGHGFYSR